MCLVCKFMGEKGGGIMLFMVIIYIWIYVIER